MKNKVRGDKMYKEYITTCDPEKGGAYLRDIGGLNKKEMATISDCYLCIEPEEGERAISVCPINYTTIAVVATKKRTSKEEPRMHSVSYGMLVKNSSIPLMLKKMEVTKFRLLYREFDEHDNLVKNEDEKFIENNRRWNSNYSGQEKVNMFFRVIQLIAKGEKILLQADETERINWLVTLYDFLLPEMACKIFVSLGGECPMNSPDILVKENIEVQNNEHEYKKRDIQEFIKEGDAFKQEYIALPELERCIANGHKEEKGLIKKCHYLRCKYKMAEYTESENIEKVLWEYEVLLELIQEESTKKIKEAEHHIVNLKEYTTANEIKEMLRTEFPFIYNIKYVNKKEKKADDPVELVMAYIKGREKEIPCNFLKKYEKQAWIEFQINLRKRLAAYSVKREECERYMEATFLAFQFDPVGSALKRGKIWCSYDLSEIYKFIHKRGLPSRLKLKKTFEKLLLE